MPFKDVNLAVKPLMLHFEERGRSPLARSWSRLNTHNMAWIIVAIFLAYVYALWVYTFTTAAFNLGFVCWFHALFVPYKYARLLGNIYGNIRYNCKPIHPRPSYNSKDVTAVIPTITEDAEELVSPIQSILDTSIQEIIIVTVGTELLSRYDMLAERLMLANPAGPRITVYSTEVKNKRTQLTAVLPKVITKFTLLVDDDIWVKKTVVPWILAPFEDASIGSVGVGMSVRPLAKGRGFNMESVFHYLGAEYRTRRNFDGAATLYHDAGISCMSGAFNCMRTSILQDPAFVDAFVNERDVCNPQGPPVMAGEDKFITRWLIEHDIGMWVQYHPDAYLQTTMENNSKYLQQCIRWSSSSWRGNYKLLFPHGFTPWTKAFWKNVIEVRSKQPWTFFAKYTHVFTGWTIITDPLLFIGHWKCQPIFANSTFPGASLLTGTTGWCIVIAWYLFSKVVKKLKDLYIPDPWTILFFPVSLCFGPFHSLIKCKSMIGADCGWRTRCSETVQDSWKTRLAKLLGCLSSSLRWATKLPILLFSRAKQHVQASTEQEEKNAKVPLLSDIQIVGSTEEKGDGDSLSSSVDL